VVKQDTKIEEIIDLMDKGGIIMIPVLENDGKIIGAVSRSDILTEKLNERSHLLISTHSVSFHSFILQRSFITWPSSNARSKANNSIIPNSVLVF
jgi:CBS domain containing-hemolysin-like protein